MNISSMLSNDSNNSTPTPSLPPQLDTISESTTSSATTTNQSDLSHNGHDLNGATTSIELPSSSNDSKSSSSSKHTNNNNNNITANSLQFESSQFNDPAIDSIISKSILSDHDSDLGHLSQIDVDYKTIFQQNINHINQLDESVNLSHDLKLLKFNQLKLNKLILKSSEFSFNYLNRVIAEDISSRNNKISDTNKNKDLIPLDYSKPLHHNTTRGKEFKWGSTREINKVDAKGKRKRPSSSSTTTPSAVAARSSASPGASPTNTSSGGSGPRLIRPKRKIEDLSSISSGDSTVAHPKRQRRKPALYGDENSKNDENSTGSTTSNGKVKLKLNLKRASGSASSTGTNANSKLKDDSSKANTAPVAAPAASSSNSKELKVIVKQYDNTYVAIWKDLSRKDGPKVSRLMQQSTQAKLINHKKTAILAAREAKRWQLKNNKGQKDLTTKARRAMREMFNFWKRNERIERELKKKHEKELLDKAKKEEEEREAKRQSRKLNFLITQTELYSHFIGKKIKTDEIEGSDSDPNISSLSNKNNNSNSHYDKYTDINHSDHRVDDINTIDFDNADEEDLTKAAAANAQNAMLAAQSKAKQFDQNHSNEEDDENDPLKNPDTNGEEMNFQNPTLLGDITIPQPNLLKCTLKEYQLKGLNWLANLYEQGINGILADEMGLGKTVQSISVLSYLAETHNIWGPFLVVTPASTLHNWQQEISRFVPDFKVLPYWGNAKDRKILRKFWDRKSFRYGRDAPFHVLVTSYQLVVVDAPYFQKMKWQYMILDEAQAIKSSQSSRWKSLLSFSCRNRLLLTGTPIQNSMQELWALLHFIMPSLFDSHDEFSDWFSKDIESHAAANTGLDEQQLRRLHVILKPFMLRRIKKNVQSELGDKVEIDLFCDLTNRQKKYYQMLRSQISIADLLETSSTATGEDATSLINLVMQFRKVCNHPDLFERADVKSPFAFGKFAETGSFLRETNDLEMNYSTQNLIEYNLPKLIYDELLIPSFENDVKTKQSTILNKFNIFNPENILSSSNEEDGSFNWLKFVDVSSQEVSNLSKQNILERAVGLKQYTDKNYEKINRFKYLYDDEDDNSFLPINKSLLIAEYNNDHALINNSIHIKQLYSIKTKVYQDMYINAMKPAAEPIASAPPITFNCSHRSFSHKLEDALFNSSIKSSLLPLSLNVEYDLLTKNIAVENFPKKELLPTPINNLIDYSNIRMPSMLRFITESGKLAKLDELLVELKKNDHRVLIYFQMTRMMDLMEEYLTYRQHTYIRLDGSSKLDDRRDLVHDWQTKPEIFIFLLSTRAGGLGINLTAADTVIFYDSDWNPTIDSQAMDRAHRLGQTRQVTVYRLLTRGTIEERMRDRAKQKEQVQQVVMEGKATTMINKKDEAANKKKDVAFLLLGEEGTNDESSTEKSTGTTPTPDGNGFIAPPKKKKRKLSADDALSSKRLEELYHEGEGSFSGNATPAP
ncbi:DNA ATP-dependent helicase [Scheffersomyces coipomensis]|uniref:DNA ATP-dependent helicase n=1 Tax=Scheffersomyces coipomensis TaxID=1788519 RepID=UPI00315DBFFB